MKNEKYDNMRSAYDNGDYRSAQRQGNSIIGEILTDAFNGIGNFFKSRSEAKRLEQERQERLRMEREAAERRAKIFKSFFTIIIIAGVGVGVFFLVKNVFLGKSDLAVKESIDIVEIEPSIADKVEPIIIEETEAVINDKADIDVADTEYLGKRNILLKTGDMIKNIFVNELLFKIIDIRNSRNLLYIVGYSFIALWLCLGGISLIVSIANAFIGLFSRKYWEKRWMAGVTKKYWVKAGSSLLSSFFMIVTVILLYYVFRGILESQITGISLYNILTIASFAIFVYSNIIIIFFIRAKNKKTNWGTVIKMIISVVVIYIPIIILRGKIGF